MGEQMATAIMFTDPLPEVTEEDGGLMVAGRYVPFSMPIEAHMRCAREHLALALYLQRNPPPDPQVEKLAGLLEGTDRDLFKAQGAADVYRRYAKALIAAGVKVEDGE